LAGVFRGEQYLACKPGIWKSNGREAKLIAHFGKSAYEQGFELKLERVREDIIEISSIFGIGDLGKSGSDDVSIHFLGAAAIQTNP
jgi:hypothetical protein